MKQACNQRTVQFMSEWQLILQYMLLHTVQEQLLTVLQFEHKNSLPVR